MASPSSRVALTICMAIVIGYVVAANDEGKSCNKREEVDGSGTLMMESSVKKLTRLTMDEISRVAPDFSNDGAIGRLIDEENRLGLSALRSCRELVDLAMDNLNKSATAGMARLCAAGTTLQTCIDGFDDQDRGLRSLVSEKLKTPISLNREDMMSSKFMALPFGQEDEIEYPRWLSEKDRKLMMRDSKMSANVVVAKDGSGNYKTIYDAVKAAPTFSKNRFVIYVKSGVYYENVKVGIEQWNVMMVGDGMDKTIIYSNLSHGGGYTTWDSATFSVQGDGFIARDMRFSNTAGAVNQQAVALLSAADRSAFYRCQIEGYQDSLFAHSNRQFYRECQIYGTIDFIFGAAAVVIQKSSIFARQPLRGQQNAITAHFKLNSACPTAIVLQSSTIAASGDLTGVSTYLGRPWTAYATVVFMQNYMDKLIDPKGWLRWDPAKDPPDTIFLAEYSNKGAGAGTQDRVKWKGVRVSLTDGEATKYTVASLIQGDQWLPGTQLPYDSGL